MSDTTIHRRECRSCGVDTEDINEFYMVHNEMWEEFGVDGQLCIGCLEESLGRELESDDFSECPLNYDWKLMSPRLKARRLSFQP